MKLTQFLRAAVPVAAFVVLGYIAVQFAGAATYSRATEAESGAVAGAAAKQTNQAGASALGTVKFGGSAQPGGGFKGPPELYTKPIIFRGDFNTGDLSQWKSTQHCPPTNTLTIDRTMLRSPDSVASAHSHVGGRATSECMSDRSRRAEVLDGGAAGVKEGDERWYQFSWRMAPEFRSYSGGNPWFIVLQWHHNGNTGSPPLSVNIMPNGDIWTGDDGVERSYHRKFDVVKPGVWRDYVIHAKFSRSASTGFVEIWVDGVLVHPKLNRPTMVDDGNYLKEGIYTDPTVAGTNDVWHDGLLVRGP